MSTAAASGSSTGVEVTRDGGVQLLRLTRTDKLNALTGAMYKTLSDALEAGDKDNEIAAHVVAGSGGVFTAGNDIADFFAAGKSAATGGVSEVVRFIMTLPRVQKPLIAAVDGPAIGIGTTMLFHCDLVYATERSVFKTPFLDLGLIPEAASSLLFPRLMGQHRAFEMLVLGETFSAERAREAGFINAIVAPEKVEETALSAGKRLARKAPEALAISRRLLRGDPAEVVARTKEEAVIFEKRLHSAEALEAFQAFLQKRPPKFTR